MYEWIDWDHIPDIITKEQFYQICHISKTTARYLLQSGKVPCRNTGKRTRCYQIRKEDVQDYLHKRGMYPEHYSATPGWYGTKRNKSMGMPRKLSPETLDRLHSYYTALLISCPDVMATNEIVALTGYCKTTVNKWCSENRMPHFVRHRTNYIPKAYLIDFFCSEEFRTVSRKTKWHIHTLRDFNQRLKADQRRAKGAKICG